MERVAVIGGGPSGLSAAWALLDGGRQVTLFEARAEAGGKLRSDQLNGALLDAAVQLLSSTYGALNGLIDATGARDLLVRSPGRDALWRDGGPHGLTYGSVASLVASGALPAGLKLRMAARYLPFLAARAQGLDANDPAGTGGAALDDASIAEWGRRELGDDFVELLAYPLLAAYYGTPPERASAALYHALAKVGMEVRLYAVRGGMGALSSRIGQAIAARGADVRLSTAVESVAVDADGATVRTASGEERFDAAVVAVPAPSARRLLPAASPMMRWLDGVEVAPAATVALVTSADIRGDFFGLSFPRTTEPGAHAVAACVQARKAPGFAAGPPHVIVVFPAPGAAAQATTASPEDTVARVMPAVELAFPQVRGAIERARVYRFDEGYTVFHPGYVRRLHAQGEAVAGRLALAGDYLVAPTVEGAVISGRRAARRLLAGG